jgi:predicted O-methyltransferase YrrM
MTEEELMACPAMMTMPERTILFGLIYALRPLAVLEIGSYSGGSAKIIVAALRKTGYGGKLVCLDLDFGNFQRWDNLEADCRLVKGDSATSIPLAAKMAGRPFDFVFIDGNHSTEYVYSDTMKSLPHLANEAYLLYHDCYEPPVMKGIHKAIARSGNLIDCGTISRSPGSNHAGGLWSGLHLLRFTTHPAKKLLKLVVRR